MAQPINFRSFCATGERHYPLLTFKKVLDEASDRALEWLNQAPEYTVISISTAVSPLINFTGYEAVVTVYYSVKA